MSSDEESVTKGYMKAIADKREKLLAQERYELVKLYAGQIYQGMWANPSDGVDIDWERALKRANELADEVIKLHPLSTKEKEGE